MKKGMVALLSGVFGAVVGGAGQGYVKNKKITERNQKVDKFKSYYNMLNQWLILKQQGKSLISYFEDNDIKTIAIYGMGEMGNRLYDELKNSNIEIKYIVDKNSSNTYSEIPVMDPDEAEFEEVDAIIVTAIFAFDEINELISEKSCNTVISLEDIIYYV